MKKGLELRQDPGAWAKVKEKLLSFAAMAGMKKRANYQDMYGSLTGGVTKSNLLTDAESAAILIEMQRTTRAQVAGTLPLNEWADAYLMRRAWRIHGTELGRAMAIRRDRVRSPMMRWAGYLGEIIQTPSPKLMDKIQSIREQFGAEAAGHAMEKWAGDVQDMLQRWQKAGIDINKFDEYLRKHPDAKMKVINDATQLTERHGGWNIIHWATRSSLLSAAITGMRNTMGGAYAVLDTFVEKPLQRLFQKIYNQATGGEEIHWGQETAESWKGFARAFWGPAFQNFGKTMFFERPTFDIESGLTDVYTQTDQFSGRPFKYTDAKGLKKAADYAARIYSAPTTAMVAMDQFFKTLHANSECAANAVRNCPEAIRKNATAFHDYMANEINDFGSQSWADTIASGETNRVTFQGASSHLEKFIIDYRAKAYEHPVWSPKALVPGIVGMLFPFVKTPVQIFQQTMIHNPLFGLPYMGLRGITSWTTGAEESKTASHKVYADMDTGVRGEVRAIEEAAREEGWTLDRKNKAIQKVKDKWNERLSSGLDEAATTNSSKYESGEMTRHLAQQVLASALIAGMWNSVDPDPKDGPPLIEFTGSPDYSDSARGERYMDNVTKPYYCLRVRGGDFVNYKNAAPMDQIFALAANTIRAIKDVFSGRATFGEAAGKYFHRLAGVTSDGTFIKGVGDIYKAFMDVDGSSGANVLRNLASQIIPWSSMVTQVGGNLDPYKRNATTYGNSDEQASFARTVLRNRGFDPSAPPRVDPFGNPMKRVPAFDDATAKFFFGMLSPFQPQQTAEGKGMEALLAVANYNRSLGYNQTGKPGEISHQQEGPEVISPMRKSISLGLGANVKLNDKELYLGEVLRGRLALSAIDTKGFKVNANNPTIKDREMVLEVFSKAGGSATKMLKGIRMARMAGKEKEAQALEDKAWGFIRKVEANHRLEAAPRVE